MWFNTHRAEGRALGAEKRGAAITTGGPLSTDQRILRVVGLATIVVLAVAACSSSGTKSSSAGSSASAQASGATTSSGDPCQRPVDSSVDKDNGTGAGQEQWMINCAKAHPLKATGDPIVLGWQNPEGDPSGTFPETTVAAKAAVDYVNNTLGGVGADLKAGKPGRPLKLQVCSTAINPADNLRCANEIASAKPFLAASTINFFGNNYPVFTAAKIPDFVLVPVTVADFTSPDLYAIGAGGGCVGVHTGLIEFVTKDLAAKKVAVPWADTPPGVVCYNDLEKKPLHILAGTADGPPEAKGKVPGLTDIGVPIKPSAADVTPQAQQVLDFKPDAIVFSAQDSDCWSLVSTLGKLGWTPSKIPLVLAGSCIDTQKAIDAGDLGKGVYFVGAPPSNQPDLLQGVLRLEAQTYLDEMKKAGASDDVSKGFAVAGFQGVMNFQQYLSTAAMQAGGADKLTGDAFVAYVKSTSNVHAFGGTPLGCKDAVASYQAVCATTVTATQFDGAKYVTKRSNFSGTYIIKGTQIDAGK